QGVLKSANGGATWTDVSKGLPNSSVTRLVIDPLTPSTLYSLMLAPGTGGRVSGTALFKTTNSGANWIALDTGLPPGAFFNVLAIDPAVPSTLYALVPPFFSGPPVNGAPPRGLLLKSTDGGESWNALDPGLPP